MAQTILGIDLGTYSVKISQIERGFGEFKLVGFYEVPLVGEEALGYPQAASAALGKFLSENPIPYDSCAVSLPGTMVSCRSMEMPFSSVKKIDQTLEFELETLIPFEIDEVLIDYIIQDVGDNTSKILTSYIPEESFKEFLGHLQHSDVIPKFVGVDSLDLSYLGMLGALPPEGRFAILDLGHTKSNFIMMEGTKVRGVRTLSWGGQTLNGALAKASGKSVEEVVRWKHSKAQIQENSDDPGIKAITEEFENLARQVKQTLFAIYESGESAIEALYIGGGTSRVSGVESFFSSKLNINVSSLDVLDDTYTELHDRESARAIIPTSFGTALHCAFSNKGAKINFCRGEYAYKKDFEELGGSLKKIGMLAASVAGIGLIYFIISFMTLSSQVDSMNKNVSKLVKASVSGLPKKGIKSSKTALSILNGKISAIDEKLRKVKGDNTLSALDVLQKVSSAMPSRKDLVVDIDDINVSPARVRLEGRTGSYEAVDKVKVSMENVSEFKNVQTGNVRKGIRNEIKFSLSFDVEGGESS